MRLADLGRQFVLREGGLDPRHKISTIGLVVGMLQLAAPALGEVAARRLLVMHAIGKRPIVEHRIAGNAEGHVSARRRHAVASGGNPNDQFVHKRSRACGIAAARSSAIM